MPLGRSVTTTGSSTGSGGSAEFSEVSEEGFGAPELDGVGGWEGFGVPEGAVVFDTEGGGVSGVVMLGVEETVGSERAVASGGVSDSGGGADSGGVVGF